MWIVLVGALHVYRISYLGYYVSCERSGRWWMHDECTLLLSSSWWVWLLLVFWFCTKYVMNNSQIQLNISFKSFFSLFFMLGYFLIDGTAGGKTSESHVGAHNYGFPKCADTILNWPGLFQWPHDVHGVVPGRCCGRLARSNWTHRSRTGQTWGTRLVCSLLFLFLGQ